MSAMSFRSKSAITALVIAAVVISASAVLLLQPRTPGPLDGIQVGIYTDRGITAASRTALEHVFQFYGANVTIIESEDIDAGFLDTCDLLVMPGGCWCEERCEILGDRMDVVIEYVENGGAYFGIDGGASYATQWPS